MTLRTPIVAAFMSAGGLVPSVASAWDPTLPQHPTTYVVDASLTEGPVANFREMTADPFGLKDQLKPKRSFVKPKVRPKVVIARDRFVISDKILFETGSAVVQAASDELLNTIAAALKAHPKVTKVMVQGHTDDVGADDFNLTLSQDRAAAVRAALAARGIPEDRLDAEGMGETDPRRVGTSDDDRRANRRVEFLIADRAVEDAPEGAQEPVEQADDAATVRERMRAERIRLTSLPKTGSLPIRNEFTSYADVTVSGVEIGRIGPLQTGIIRDLPSGWYDVEFKIQNGLSRTIEVKTEVVNRPAIPGNATAQSTLEEGLVYSWHDDPSKGHEPERKAKRLRPADKMQTTTPSAPTTPQKQPQGTEAVAPD